GFWRRYQITGVQELPLNTLPQLATAIAARDESLTRADRLLMMPDYFHSLLGGEARNEASIASTTQMLDASTGDWSAEVFSKIGLPARLIRPPCSPGTSLGRLRADL